MKKKFILLSSFLFALAITGCSCSKQIPDVIIDDENNQNEPSSKKGKGLSDYADKDGNLTDEGWKKMIKDSYKFCEEEVEQGSVLLFNNYIDEDQTKKALPLADNERNVSLFGQGTRSMYLRSGSGGPAPNENLVIDLEKAFETNGFNINRTLLGKYSVGYITNPNPDRSYEADFNIYTDSVKATFDDYNDAAIITIVRAGTENADPNRGALDLTQNELQMIQMVKDSGKFKKVILLINSPMPISLDFLKYETDECPVDAAIWMGVPGYYGSGGVVHLLMGKDANGNPLSPSGHLPETFVDDVDSAPATVNFGNSRIAVYQEGIYVGYKYYETRYEDLIYDRANASSPKGSTAPGNGEWDYHNEVTFPFGYGESYTEFSSKITDITYNSETDQYEVDIEVKNIGRMDAKYTGQVYVQQPYTEFDKTNGLEKSAIALAGYEKVDVKAGQTVNFTVDIDRYFLTTYDNVVNKTYILEGGDYYFGIGNGAHEALNNILSIKSPALTLYDHDGLIVHGDNNCARKITIAEDKVTYSKSRVDSTIAVTNKFDDADYNYHAEKNGGTKIKYLSRQDWLSTWPTQITTSPASNEDKDMSRLYSSSQENKGYASKDGIEYNVQALLNNERITITFAEMTIVPLEGIVTNENSRFKGMEGSDVWDMFIKQMDVSDLAISITDNRGLLSVMKVQKPGNTIAEGAEGLLATFKYGDKRWATGFATGPNYTSTWDHRMQKKFGSMFAEEALFCGINSVNGPGANIIRSAYTSRASEYMSEDAILNYNCAANIVGEARKKGLIMNIKHALLNNQETGRQRLETYCNEQAIREIYLKPFEGAIVKGEALGVITSYNRVGATYAATHSNLMNGVMRGEWGFKGFIMNSALTGSNSDTYSNGPAMIHAGTDLFALDGDRGNQLVTYVRNTDDLQILKDMQRANKYIMYAISRSSLGYSLNPSINKEDSGSDPVNPIIPDIGGDTVITDEIRNIANAYDYDFDPTAIHYKKEDLTDSSGQFDFGSNISSLPTNGQREGVHLVYKFEGAYTEGWQGDYSSTYSYLYLWEDGYFTGKAGNKDMRGYWYDSDENGEGNILVLVTSNNSDGTIVGYKQDTFYSWAIGLQIQLSWGTRSSILEGYMYYPDVALHLNTGDTDFSNIRVGSTIDISSWTVERILKNLNHGAIFEDDTHKITWQVNGSVINDRIININSTGEYRITATWGGFVTGISIVVA